MYRALGLILASILFHSLTFAGRPTTVKIDGSSTVYPITEAVAEEFQILYRNKIRVTVGISGTGGGFKKFCRGETHIQNASRPIHEKEMKTCKAAGIKFIELPVAYDAAVVVVNPENDFVNEMSVEQLKKIWEPAAEGKIKRWNQIDPNWPDQEFQLYGAGTDSGTFDYFTEAIVGKSKSSRTDYTASEDDNTLVTGVSGDRWSLGYIPLSYYEENKTKLKAVGIIGGEKAPKKFAAVFPSKETVESGEYFPLSRPLFIYVSDLAYQNPDVKILADFYLSNAGKLSEEANFVALPAKAYELAKSNLSGIKTGTSFGGHSSIGVKVEELLTREGKL